MTLEKPRINRPDDPADIGKYLGFDGSVLLPTTPAGGGSGGGHTLITGLTANSSGAAGANTTAIQAACNAAETAGGGWPTVPLGLYYINNTIMLGSRVALCGLGWGSRLFLANGTAANGAPKPMIKAKDSTNYVGVMDLYLDGNKANQTDNVNYLSHGVDFATGRTATSGGGNPTFDGGLYLWNVMATQCQGDGFKVDGFATTMRVGRCYAYQNDIFGFRLKTDFIISDSVSAQNGHGFHVENGSSGMLVNLKGFGNDTDYKVGYSKAMMFANCASEDFGFTGFTVTACDHITLASCVVYRSVGTDNLRSGFWIEDDGAGTLCDHIVLRACEVRGTDFGNGIRWALLTRNLGVGCDFEINSDDMVAGRWTSLSGSKDCRAVFDNNYLDATQTVAYGATVTPNHYLGGTVDIGALTGNITIGAPSEPYVGQHLRLNFLQDGTGGRTVTWNAAFDTTWQPAAQASSRSSITFRYNGTNWAQVAATPDYRQRINAQTGTAYTPALTDIDGLVTQSNASAITTTLPQDSAVSFPIGSRIDFAQIGAGQVTFVAGTGATVNATPGLKIAAQYGVASAYKRAANTWLVTGALSA